MEQCAPEIPAWQVKEEPPFLAITSKSNKIVELAARSLKHDFLRSGLGSIDRGGAAKNALGISTKNHNHKRVQTAVQTPRINQNPLVAATG